MTRIIFEASTCAFCGGVSEQPRVQSAFFTGEMDLDSRKHMGVPLFAKIEFCPHCKYIARDISVKDFNVVEIIASERYMEILKDHRYPEICSIFRAAAYIKTLQNDIETSALYALYALWACRGLTRKKHRVRVQRIRKEAIDKYEELISLKGLFKYENSLILVDLLRRSGLFQEAIIHAEKALEKWSDIEIVNQVLKFQICLCERQDIDLYLVSEVVNND